MPERINDAESYGVRIIEAIVSPGATFWKAVRVHHLTPEENQGKHHIFIDVIDEDGKRLLEKRIRITWDGGEEFIVINRAEGPYGADFPMWKWQICNAELAQSPSDRVENLHTAHADEAPGNTLFHHSFAITFQRALAPVVTGQSTIYGQVPGGSGHTLVLRHNEVEIATTVVGPDELYRFTQVPAGTYEIVNRVDGRLVGPVTVDGTGGVELNFPPLKALDTYFLFGAATSAVSQLHLSIMADHLSAHAFTFGFDLETAKQANKVTLVGDHPQETEAALNAVGCQIERLPADPSALLAALDR